MATNNKWQRWTDTDNAIVLTFSTTEAAELLGRTKKAVYHRRSGKGLGVAHGNRKPKKKLLRQYFATGEGPREEVIPAPVQKCRYCAKAHYTRGVCKACYRWVQRLVEAKVVTWELAEKLWLGGRRD